MSQSARDIYQRHLDTVSEAMWSEDHDRVAQMMHYPHTMIYSDRQQIVRAPEELAETSRLAKQRLLDMGASAYHRVCLSAEFDVASPSRIIGRHMTFVLNGGTYLVPPYQGRMTLEIQDHLWRGIGILTEVDPTKINLLHPDLSEPRASIDT
ncbi:hypothetical protein [Jannaschia sp. M317]|uniref:hypothetical protein n=1 Tax=Jannaschia sp. M317 TaxID=2867011 RepID=UPI0021A8C174|nr:hypothetical protein [Jannaschia sp. M317]UWQ16502.1 hypothetical protein K3551_11305 [Jannaschia sp. M317]